MYVIIVSGKIPKKIVKKTKGNKIKNSNRVKSLRFLTEFVFKLPKSKRFNSHKL